MSKKKHKHVAKSEKDEKAVEAKNGKPGVEAAKNRNIAEEKDSSEKAKHTQKTTKVADADGGEVPTPAPDSQIIELEAQIAKLEDDLLRQRAETENFKRRTKQEYETNLTYANQRLIEQLLPVLDAFDRALATENHADAQTKQFLKGFEMTASLLKETLQQAGLTVIPSVGEPFDPYLHQAVAQGTDETKADHEILEELQKGYKLKDRVIRASMVKTNKK